MARPTVDRLRRDIRRSTQATRTTRRLPAASTGAATWDLDGNEGLDDDAEEPSPEVFGTAGILARPDGAPEAVVVAVGGDGHDVIVATRDHAWAVACGAADMPIGETWVYNRKAFIRITADGDVEIGRPDGTFEAVATVSHVHGPGNFATAGGGGPVNPAGRSGAAVANPLGGRGIAKNAKAES